VRQDELLETVPAPRAAAGQARYGGDERITGVARRGALARARAAAGRQVADGSVLAPAAIPSQFPSPEIERGAPRPVLEPALAPIPGSLTPGPLVPTAPAVRRRGARFTIVATSAFLVLVLGVGAVVASAQASTAHTAQVARAQARPAALVTARADDESMWEAANRAARQRVQEVAAADAVVAAAGAVLATTPQAGDAPRAAPRSRRLRRR
jgi:hypothetical protein